MTTSAQPPTRWHDAEIAAAIVAVVPFEVGGILLRAGHGPVRDAWFALLKSVNAETSPIRRVPVDVPLDRLVGGLDLAQTLRSGRVVAERGVLVEADGGVVILPTAERASSATTSAIAAALDTGIVRVARDGVEAATRSRFGVIAIDEGIDGDAPVAMQLRDRLSMTIDLGAMSIRDIDPPNSAPLDKASIRQAMAQVECDGDVLSALSELALALGIQSLRPVCGAVMVARASAALHARDAVGQDDIAFAVRTVLAPRAVHLPMSTDAGSDDTAEHDVDQQMQNPNSNDQPQSESVADPGDIKDIMLAAVAAALPDGLLDAAAMNARPLAARQSGGRSGVMNAKAARRGKRIGARRGDPRRGERIDILETLRVAAPWQPVRRRDRQDAQRHASKKVSPDAHLFEVRLSDLRVHKFKSHSESATIFVVDASGSAALHRLAEAKGAVELLLSDCYARRDHVALIAFRGRTAELVLPPTRSLVRAKRSLACVPGGGSTPLATAIDEAMIVGRSAVRKGQAPTLVFLTDGRANVGRNGVPGRGVADSDAIHAAKLVKNERISAIVIDTSPRPGGEAPRFATAMGAKYMMLPHADATTLSNAVRTLAQ
jgi:magnesium chelatase subunit D